MKSFSNKSIFLNGFFLALLLSFTFQQFSISTAITPIRPYMIMVSIGGIIFSLNKFRVKLTTIDIFLSVLYLYMMATFIYSEEISLSIQMFFGLNLLLYSYFILRIFIYQYSLNEFVEKIYFIAKWFFILSFFLYVIGVLAHYLFDVSIVLEGGGNRAVLLGVYFEGGITPRMRGLCDSPNNFGMYAIIMLPVWLNYSPGIKWWQLSIVSIMLILSFSTTMFLALICMFFIFILNKFFNSNGKVSRKLLVLIIFYTILFFVISGSIYFVFLDGLSADLNAVIGYKLDRVSSGSGRFELWQYSWSLISENPVFGYGLNQARIVLAPYRQVNSTHNNFLEVMLEGGVGGLLLYLFLLSSVFVTVFSKSMMKKERQWVLITLVGLFIFSNANVNLYSDSFIFCLAIIATLPLLKNTDPFKNGRPEKQINC